LSIRAALALAESNDQLTVRQSIDELQRLGASPAAAIVARRLRERGVRGVPRGPRPRTRDNPAGLTARELEVLALLAEGLRNAQIAKRLVVSEKTVEHHVSAILRKLDVRSRGEAGRESRAARAGTSKIGTASSQYGESSRCARAPALVGSCQAQSQRVRRTYVPRYIVQRTFPDGLEIPVDNGGADICRKVVERNADEGVTWLHSYVSRGQAHHVLRL